MDDVVQVLIFIATFIIFIFSAIKKQKKKAGNSGLTVESVLESFLGGSVKGEPNTQANRSDSVYEESYVEEKVVLERDTKKRRFEEGIAVISDKDGIYDEVMDEPDTEEDEREFNLRDAIVYSEILKRREY